MKKEEKKNIAEQTAESLADKVKGHFEESKKEEPEKPQEEPVKKQSVSLIDLILDHILGKKYYAVVSNRNGTFSVGLHEAIFTSKSEAKHLLDGVESYQEVEIISFRSRLKYITSSSVTGFGKGYSTTLG